MRGVDKAPARIDLGVVQQPFDRALAAPRDRRQTTTQAHVGTVQRRTAGAHGNGQPFQSLGVGTQRIARRHPLTVNRYPPHDTGSRTPVRPSGALRPDMDRRREPLESYPLESMQMVGILMQGRNTHALIKANNALHQVKVGNYMGQNFGVVTQITETEVTLRELVEDVYGDWVERITPLTLQERQEAGK